MICENCNKEFIPIDKYHQRFCCNQCARSFSSKFNRGKRKIVYCECCNKPFDASINSSKKLCDTCQAEKYSQEYIKTHIYKKIYSNFNVCRICGKVKDNNCEYCTNHNLRQLNSIINRTDFNKDKFGTPNVFDEINRIKDKVEKLYIDDKKSCVEIGNIYNNEYPNSFGNILKYLNIKRREFCESTKNAILTGRYKTLNCSYKYHTCYHTTWDNQTVYLRSSYELDYAKELDDKHIHYEVEDLRIPYIRSMDNKEHIAIPDFYIPSQNLIVEIKSSYTYNEREMNDKFNAYKKLGYNVQLILDHKIYNI